MTNPATQGASLQQERSSALVKKIADRSACVGIIGMGYVGLPTMIAIAEQGFKVTGIDINGTRVDQINDGKSYIEDVPDSTLDPLVKRGMISATPDYAVLHDLDVVLICVPTPITNNKEPDLQPMRMAVTALAKHMGRDQLVILQSTTFPGTTQELVQPELEKSGRQAGRDFYLAFALERMDPGNAEFAVGTVPKVVGGVTPECLHLAEVFFVNLRYPSGRREFTESSRDGKTVGKHIPERQYRFGQ